MRFRGARLLAGLFVLFLARGCYSSVAPTAKIDPGETDSGPPGVIEPTPDACVARKPWEGPGVTGLLPVANSRALVLSGDRYFEAEFDTAGTDASDPTIGRLLGWRQTGLLKDIWRDAPPAFGAFPWDDPGVTAAHLTQNGGGQIIISHSRRWARDGTGWPAAGSVVDDWVVNDAGPHELDGQVPWEGPGVTAAYFSPSKATFYVISKDRLWTRRTFDEDPRNWTWTDGGEPLADAFPWRTAPAIAGQRPWDGKGVTAAYYIGPRLFVISTDKMWIYDGTRWTASGALEDLAGWTSAPAAGCAR